MHENRRRFESQNASHMALFSASRAFCFQWITRHNANYAQMPGCPLCTIPIYAVGIAQVPSVNTPTIRRLLRVDAGLSLVNSSQPMRMYTQACTRHIK